MRGTVPGVISLLLIALAQIFYTSPAVAEGKFLPPDARLKSAYKLRDSGHPEQAVRMMMPYINTPFANAYFYDMLAECFSPEFNSDSANLLRARAYCQKAIALEPDYGYSYYVIGKIDVGDAENENAAANFTRAINSPKPFMRALFLRASVYSAQKKYVEAVRDLDLYDKWNKDHNVTTASDLKESLPIRAQIFQAQGKYDLAVQSYRKSYPEFQYTHVEAQVILCLGKQKKYAEAIEVLSSRIKKDNQDYDSYFTRAQMKMQLSDFSGAVCDYTSAIAITPTSSYYKERALAYQKLGKADLAKKDLEKAEAVF